MNYKLLIISLVNQNIKNFDIPACKNCVYYKPELYLDFISSTNKCEKFATKDIITDEISYEFVTLCRTDENKCGYKGIYFEKEPNMKIKELKHIFSKNIPYLFICIVILGRVILLLK